MLAISLFHNDSLLNPNVLPIDPFFCFFTHPGKIIYSTSNFLHAIIILCPCIFVLYLGFQQLQQKSAYSSAATISHFDIFTFHMAGIELIGALGSIVSITAIYVENVNIFSIGLFIFSFTWYGQIFFHTLTCVERYLAVIHPIVYLCLKTAKGIRIRNVCMGCIWLFCFGGMNAVKTGNYIFLDFFLLVSSTKVISFCSVSVLCILIHRPGKQGRERADQSKKKAFYTIVAILGILMFRLCFGLIWGGLDLSGHIAQCLLMSCAVYINLPSGLVLPLLFLQRKGKLLCCKSR